MNKIVGTKGGDLDLRTRKHKQSLKLKPRRPTITMASTEPGMALRHRGVPKNKGEADSENAGSKKAVVMALSSNKTTLIPTNNELAFLYGKAYYNEWTDPKDVEPGERAVRVARVKSKKRNQSKEEFFMEADQVNSSSPLFCLIWFVLHFLMGYFAGWG